MPVTPKKAVYVAIFGDKDDLIEVPKIPGYDFIVFSDDTTLKTNGWELWHSPREFEDPTRDARKRKLLAHSYLPDYSHSLWIDGNITLDDIDLDALFESHLKEADIAVHNHPLRDCVYQEGATCVEILKDDPNLILPQMEKYRNENYPAHNGLSSTCIMFRRHTEEVARFEKAWWHELDRHSRRDQLSFNYIAWTLGQKFEALSGHVRDQNVPGFTRIAHKKTPDVVNW